MRKIRILLSIASVIPALAANYSFGKTLSLSIFSKDLNAIERQLPNSNKAQTLVLVQRLKVLENDLNYYLHTERGELDRAVSQYKTTFSFFQRMNPWDVGSENCERNVIKPLKYRISEGQDLQTQARELLYESQRKADLAGDANKCATRDCTAYVTGIADKCATRDCTAYVTGIADKCATRDCTAYITGIADKCATRDCTAYVTGIADKCATRDCTAYVTGIADKCATRDCTAYVTGDPDKCATRDCTAFLSAHGHFPSLKFKLFPKTRLPIPIFLDTD